MSTFKKVLVIGGRKVGKTSLLSAAVANEFTNAYAPTMRANEYFDVARQLIYIDTPGLESSLLDLVKFSNFENDPVVQEYYSQNSETKEVIGELKVDTVSAYCIVYGESYMSRSLAESMRELIRKGSEAHNPHIPIFMVKNRGDIPMKLEEESREAKHKKDLLDPTSSYNLWKEKGNNAWMGDPGDDETSYHKVAVATYFGVRDLMDTIRDRIKHSDDHKALDIAAKRKEGSECSLM